VSCTEVRILGSGSLYLLSVCIKVLRSHSMCVDALKDIIIQSSSAGQVALRLSSLMGGSLPLTSNSASKHSSVKVLGSRIVYNQHHDLQQFLPYLNSHSYSLRARRHNSGCLQLLEILEFYWNL